MADPHQVSVVNDSQWKTQQFRQKVVGQIEEAMRQSGNPITKTSLEMEMHVFQKAKTREEYLALVARLIIHVREINSKKKSEAGGFPGQGASGPGGQGAIQDPINALTNLTRQGPSTSVPQPGQPAQGPVPGQQMQPMQQQQQQQQQQQHQQQQPGMPQRPPFPPYQQQHPMQQQQPGMQAANMRQMHAMVGQGMPRPDMFMPQPGMQPGMFPGGAGGQPMGPMGPQGMPGPDNFMPQPTMPGMYHPGQQQPMGMQQMPPGSQGMGPMPSPLQGSMPVSSPASLMPSPSSQQNVLTPSSVPGHGQAPSPGMCLNTPGNPGSVGQSPGTDESDYLTKLKQLQKYIEPLKRMIKRMDKDGEDKKRADFNKMKGLLDILTDSSKRLPMTTLLKCEQVLKQNFRDEIPPTTHVFPLPVKSDPLMCQVLLDAVASQIKSPLLNHTLQRTFGPALQAIHGPPIRAPSPPAKRKRVEEEPKSPSDVPDLLQGEIARLEHRFHVDLDPLHHTGSKTVHLVCKLDDKNLPSVPPLAVTVPERYPDCSPTCDPAVEDYDATPFLQCVQRLLLAQLLKMPDKYSITALLDTWEMSIRKACSPVTA